MGVLRKKVKPTTVQVDDDRQGARPSRGSVNVERVTWIARGKILDVADHLDTVLCRVRHRVETAESREAAEEAFADERIGVTAKSLARSLNAGHVRSLRGHGEHFIMVLRIFADSAKGAAGLTLFLGWAPFGRI
jgi:hypothetical protein